MPNERRILLKVCLDIICLLTVGIPILLFFLIGKPKQRGYFCDDDSIRYPYEESTVSNTALYLVGILVPVAVISLVEFVNDNTVKRRKNGQTLVLLGRPVPPLAWQLYVRVGVFLFGACLSQLTTDIAKYSIGRLRPHFLDICKPNVECTSTNQHVYNDNFTCTGTDAFRIKESRLSFPSGHSSFSAYSMVYLVIYLQMCMRCDTNRLLKPFLQFLFLMATWFTALSRIADYKHHWSDVLVGALQGTIVSLIVAYYVSDLFTKRPEETAAIPFHSGPSQLTTNYNTMDLESSRQSSS